MKYLAYLSAIAFQLSGALLLIIKYWFKSVDKQLAQLEHKRTHIEGETLHIEKSLPANNELVEEIWINRFAFLYLAVGYVISIWGNTNDECRLMSAFLVLIITIILVVTGKRIAHKASSKYEEGLTNESKT